MKLSFIDCYRILLGCTQIEEEGTEQIPTQIVSRGQQVLSKSREVLLLQTSRIDIWQNEEADGIGCLYPSFEYSNRVSRTTPLPQHRAVWFSLYLQTNGIWQTVSSLSIYINQFDLLYNSKIYSSSSIYLSIFQ